MNLGLGVIAQQHTAEKEQAKTVKVRGSLDFYTNVTISRYSIGWLSVMLIIEHVSDVPPGKARPPD